MAEPAQYDFGQVDDADVETFGQPGQRTFRLIVERGDRTASLWLEKEQLQAVGLVIEQHLNPAGGRGYSGSRTLLTLAARFPSKPTIDFKVGRLALGFDEQTSGFTVSARNVEDVEETEPEFTCVIGPSHAIAISAKTTEIVSAGRPRCPLCGAPMDGPHVCPATNGHAH
ncbi:MAG: hypothetical protein QOF51_2612 [Chloroflexota bacterium]|jgi:uncharacterized repeat protein (TIGR03847 family)|nr:hypothetical protein [Chloroflexota bacterium]